MGNISKLVALPRRTGKPVPAGEIAKQLQQKDYVSKYVCPFWEEKSCHEINYATILM